MVRLSVHHTGIGPLLFNSLSIYIHQSAVITSGTARPTVRPSVHHTGIGPFLFHWLSIYIHQSVVTTSGTARPTVRPSVHHTGIGPFLFHWLSIYIHQSVVTTSGTARPTVRPSVHHTGIGLLLFHSLSMFIRQSVEITSVTARPMVRPSVHHTGNGPLPIAQCFVGSAMVCLLLFLYTLNNLQALLCAHNLIMSHEIPCVKYLYENKYQCFTVLTEFICHWYESQTKRNEITKSRRHNLSFFQIPFHLRSTNTTAIDNNRLVFPVV